MSKLFEDPQNTFALQILNCLRDIISQGYDINNEDTRIKFIDIFKNNNNNDYTASPIVDNKDQQVPDLIEIFNPQKLILQFNVFFLQ